MLIKNRQPKFFGKSKTLSSYLNDIRRYKPLTAEEEISLFDRLHNGDETAVDELIKHNQRFVYSMAKIYAKSEEEVLDYVNEGNIGLIEAIERFNDTRGFKFLTFAVLYIKREMNYYLKNTNLTVRRSNNMKLSKKIDNAKWGFYAKNGFTPTEEMIADIIEETYGVKVNDNSDLYDVNVCSISEQLNEDGENMEDDDKFTARTSNTNEYEDKVEQEYNNSVIEKIFSGIGLDEKNADIIKMLFGIGYDREYTVPEVGAKFDLDDKTVNMLKNRTLMYIRQELKKERVYAV